MYQLSTIHELPSLVEQTFNIIERCFTMLVETPNFLELDYTVLAKVLSRSELHITSELEVFNAVNAWLKYNIEERKEFAKQLLLRIRLPLLSDAALRDILNKASPFTAIDECVFIIKQVLERKESVVQTKPDVFCTNRYCNQKMFNMIVFGGYAYRVNVTLKTVFQVDGSNLSSVKRLPSMLQRRRLAKAVCVKGEVFVFGGRDGYLSSYNYSNNPVMAVEKYSPATEAWNQVTELPDGRDKFCICAFMDKIFVIGGFKYDEEDFDDNDDADIGTITNSCSMYDTKNNSWKEVAGMNFARKDAACEVFKGRILVSGGKGIGNNKMKSVESFDVIADEWSLMPDMINVKSGHSLVAVKSKLFVIGFDTDTSEVFDSICKKFTTFKTPLNFVSGKAVPIGNKILIIQWETQEEEIQDNTRLIVCYDVDKNEWSKESWETTKDLDGFTCVTFPRL